MKIAAVIAVTLLLAIAPIAAHGDETSGAVPAKARTLANRGRAAHDAGDYGTAIEAFTQAYVMAPNPALLFNLAQAYRLEGRCDDAALMYRRFLATNPEAGPRALAETHLASVERCMHKLALHIPVEITGKRVDAAPAAPLMATARAVPGSRRAQIEKDVGVGLAIGGGVSLAVAAYYAVQAHDAAGDVAAAYARGDKWKQIAPIDERGQSAATRAKLFGAGGALGLAGGIITYLLGRHDEGPPITVSTSQHGLKVGVRWTY